MNFLVSQTTCADPGLASVLAIVKNILNLIEIIAPILLIIMLAVNFIRLATKPDDKKGLPRIKNSVIALVVIFMIPVIVNAVMYVLDDSFTISDCWNNATYNPGGGTYVDPNGKGKKQKVTVDPSQYERGIKKATEE